MLGAREIPRDGSIAQLSDALCGSAQPLMAYPPFYNMPFPYPPAASAAQVPSEHAAGASVAEKKPGDTNGQSKSGDDSSNPVGVLETAASMLMCLMVLESCGRG